MLSSRIDRLFHSLVVLGAAMGAGCDPHVEVPGATGGSGGGQGGSGASTSMGGSTGTTSGSVGPGSTGSTGSGTTTPPMPGVDDPSDCEYSSQFACNAEGTCHCDPSLPKGPQDCLSTTDFFCQQYTPEYVTCYCEPAAPDKPEDCDDPTIFYCAIDNPPIGCYCLVPIA